MCRHLAPCDSQPVMLALKGTDWANEGFYRDHMGFRAEEECPCSSGGPKSKEAWVG